jgi:hypothetical protein
MALPPLLLDREGRVVLACQPRCPAVAARTTGSCLTGKFTELAMKHFSRASRCSPAAFWTMPGEATVTRGRSTTSMKWPPFPDVIVEPPGLVIVFSRTGLSQGSLTAGRME